MILLPFVVQFWLKIQKIWVIVRGRGPNTVSACGRVIGYAKMAPPLFAETVTKTLYFVRLIFGTTKVAKSTKIGISLEYSIV